MRDDCNFHGAVYAGNKHNSSQAELFALQIQERLSPALDMTLTIHGTRECSNTARVKLLQLFNLIEIFPEPDSPAASTGLSTRREWGSVQVPGAMDALQSRAPPPD